MTSLSLLILKENRYLYIQEQFIRIDRVRVIARWHIFLIQLSQSAISLNTYLT